MDVQLHYRDGIDCKIIDKDTISIKRRVNSDGEVQLSTNRLGWIDLSIKSLELMRINILSAGSDKLQFCNPKNLKSLNDDSEKEHCDFWADYVNSKILQIETAISILKLLRGNQGVDEKEVEKLLHGLLKRSDVEEVM